MSGDVADSEIRCKSRDKRLNMNGFQKCILIDSKTLLIPTNTLLKITNRHKKNSTPRGAI
jgi:hypothetical protein